MDDQTPPAGAAVPLSLEEQGRLYQLLGQHETLHEQGERHSHEDARELDELLARSNTLLGFPRKGRIPMTDNEHAAVDKLLLRHDGASAGLCRRDPGNTGPVVVEIPDAGVWHIDENGKATKQKAAI